MPVLLLPALLALAPLTQAPPAPDLLPHAALNERLRALAAAHPDLCRTLPIAHSHADREVLALELRPKDAPADRPAILLVANLEGPQVFTSGLALWQAEQLLERHAAGDVTARALLDDTTLYIVPRANPDAAEARFASPLAEQHGTGHGADDDRDGRSGEDGPADLDGDGFVTMLRVPDPDGTWIEDPTDPRAMVEADPFKGERGQWKLYPEGLDSDGDEAVGEDPAADCELNRNFAHEWEEHVPAAGLFPMDEPEARGLAEFVLAHDDIGLVVCYGALDNLVEAPKTVKQDAPAQKRIPAPGVIEPDAKVLAELGLRYADLVEPQVAGTGSAAGSFQAWTYHHRGLLTVSIRPWDIPLDAKQPEPEATDESEAPDEDPATDDESAPAKDKPKPSDDAKRLLWMDVEQQLDRFRPWTPFDHPQLGPVEVGGFAPYARTEPPAEDAAALAEAQLQFLTTLGADLPRVRLGHCTAAGLGGGLVEIEAAVAIEGLLPLQTASAQRTRTVRPARVRLVLPDGVELVAGRAQEFISELGVGDRATFRWLIHGPPGITDGGEVGVSVDTDNASSDRRELEVSR